MAVYRALAAAKLIMTSVSRKTAKDIGFDMVIALRGIVNRDIRQFGELSQGFLAELCVLFEAINAAIDLKTDEGSEPGRPAAKDPFSVRPETGANLIPPRQAVRLLARPETLSVEKAENGVESAAALCAESKCEAIDLLFVPGTEVSIPRRLEWLRSFAADIRDRGLGLGVTLAVSSQDDMGADTFRSIAKAILPGGRMDAIRFPVSKSSKRGDIASIRDVLGASSVPLRSTALSLGPLPADGVPLSRLMQERSESEAAPPVRVFAKIRESRYFDLIAFEPFEAEYLSILPDGRRVARVKWKGASGAGETVLNVPSIHQYLNCLASLGEDIETYADLWFF